jgi:hypothetical protein
VTVDVTAGAVPGQARVKLVFVIVDSRIASLNVAVTWVATATPVTAGTGPLVKLR